MHCSTCSRNHILRLHLYMWKQKTREKKNQSTDPIRSERKIWITTILLELSYAKTAPSISSPNVVLIARRHPTTYSPPPVTSILLRNKKPLYVILSISALSLSLSLSLSVLSSTLLSPAFPPAKVPSQIRDCKWNLSAACFGNRSPGRLHEAHADKNKSWNESITSEQASAAAAALDHRHTDKDLQHRSKP